MLLKEKLSKLENSKVFLDWREKDKDSYLAHIFRMFDQANKNIWQFGYYNPDDTITTFILKDDEISEVPEQEIFKPDKRKIPKLDITEVKIGFDTAMEKAEKLHQKKYPKHPIMKSFAILQNIKEKQVFNITFVTQTFSTLNIRIDPSDGDIVSEKLTSLMDIAQFKKGDSHDSDASYIG